MGSHASQLAKAVCLYSPWQFVYWYDRPSDSPRGKGGAGNVEKVITNEPELEFFKHVPTVWDDTRVIHGAIGKFATIARQSGNEWYVGCINGDMDRPFGFDLNFLAPDKKYVATIYSDDSSMNTRTNVRIERFFVTAGTNIAQEILKNNGLAMWIVPATEKDEYPEYK